MEGLDQPHQPGQGPSWDEPSVRACVLEGAAAPVQYLLGFVLWHLEKPLGEVQIEPQKSAGVCRPVDGTFGGGPDPSEVLERLAADEVVVVNVARWGEEEEVVDVEEWPEAEASKDSYDESGEFGRNPGARGAPSAARTSRTRW